MKRSLIVMILVSGFVFVACGGGNSGGTGESDAGDSGTGECSGSNMFCHSHGGLNWSDRSASGMDWDSAVAYCEGLGGRLPTISELRTLIENCPATEKEGECGVMDSCYSSNCWHEDDCIGCTLSGTGKYSVFGDFSMMWSSSSHDETNEFAWSVSFIDARVVNLIKVMQSDVRCVQ